MGGRNTFHTIVVGAGPTGLAVGFLLHGRKIDYCILEKAQIGHSWADKYSTLTLVTPESFIEIPGWMRKNGNAYLSGRSFHDKLVEYSNSYNLNVCIGITVSDISEYESTLRITTSSGLFFCKNLVLAVGRCAFPFVPTSLLDTFVGIHASEYRDAESFRASEVVIFGSSVSAIDIALELADVARSVTIFSRNGVNIVPRISGNWLSHIVYCGAKYHTIRLLEVPFLILWKLIAARGVYGAVPWLSDPGRFPIPKPHVFSFLRQRKIRVEKHLQKIVCRSRDNNIVAIFATGYLNGLEAISSSVDLRPRDQGDLHVIRTKNGSKVAIIGAGLQRGSIWLADVGSRAEEVMRAILQ